MEVRDPIHNLITYNDKEKKIIDSPPFQRLRHIHQLAMGYLVYPGATHKRFEHSIGVMHLAGMAFDSIMADEKIGRLGRYKRISNTMEKLKEEKKHWRQTLRLAALCHDIGHLPFSHSGEDAHLFSNEKHHEWMTVKLIKECLASIMEKFTPAINPIIVAKISVGGNKWEECNAWGEEHNYFSDEELILTEIVTGDFFGVDRMDYLLRDAYHSGVSYGTIDHQRLLDTLTVLPNVQEKGTDPAPSLGIEKGGLHSAEGMIVARYFMYKQVYFHRVRKVYDKHLADCMNKIFDDKKLDNINDFLKWTDNEIIVKIREALRDPGLELHKDANLLLKRKHYRCIYTITLEDLKKDKKYLEKLLEKLKTSLNAEERNELFSMEYPGKPEIPQFPVLLDDGEIEDSKNASELYDRIPPAAYGYIFASPNIKDKIIDEINEIKNDEKNQRQNTHNQ